jgi:hypothetical protein
VESVLVIAPTFGSLTDRIILALTDVLGPENVRSIVYRESDFERRSGVFVSRILRMFVQSARVSQHRRAKLEMVISRVRFRNGDLAEDVLCRVDQTTCQHLVLVKPTYLDNESLAELVQRTGAERVSIVLWDALWRTPTIKPLLGVVDQVFSTEPVDAEKTACIQLLPIPAGGTRQVRKEQEGTDDQHSGVQFFYCGSWSLDRFIAAVKFRQASRFTTSSAILHLVTGNPILVTMNRLLGFKSARLTEVENQRFQKHSDVLIDFGRIGQTSPSERMLDAKSNSTVLLTTNVAFAKSGAPIVFTADGFREAIDRSLELCAHSRSKETIAKDWAEMPGLDRFFLSGSDWASTVLQRSRSNPRISAAADGMLVPGP